MAGEGKAVFLAFLTLKLGREAGAKATVPQGSDLVGARDWAPGLPNSALWATPHLGPGGLPVSTGRGATPPLAPYTPVHPGAGSQNQPQGRPS